MQNACTVEESESVTVANEPYTEVQVFRIRRPIAVFLEDVPPDKSCNVAHLGARS